MPHLLRYAQANVKTSKKHQQPKNKVTHANRFLYLPRYCNFLAINMTVGKRGDLGVGSGLKKQQ